MRRCSLILSLLLTVLLWACRREDSQKASPDREGHVSITVEFPKRVSDTKSEASLAAEDDENAVHSLCIWVFREDKGTLLENSPLVVNSQDIPEAGGVREFIVPVDWSFVLKPPMVRVFILANAESIGFDLSTPRSYSMEDLENAVFGHDENHDYFGVSSADNLVRSVPAEGLPMSAVASIQPFGTAPALKLGTLTLQRMVSRVRLIFCQTDVTPEPGQSLPSVSISEVVFSGNTLPTYEYLFTENETGIQLRNPSDPAYPDNNYEADAFSIPWGDAGVLCKHEAPERLVYVNQDPVSYEEMLDEAIVAGKLNDLGYVYLRETNRKLKGRVRYQVNGVSRFREFVMESENDFARNHTWTLFAYFLSGRNLQLRVAVLPWDRTDSEVSFSKQSVNVVRPLTLDEQSVEKISKLDRVLLPGVVAHAWIQITTPVGGTLYVKPVGGTKYFTVSTDKDNLEQITQTINPNINSGRVDIYIRPSDTELDPDDMGTLESSITLSFSVEIGDRWIDANTEAIDDNFRFYRRQ